MDSVKDFSYERDSVRAGIAHIGVGNFHRSHQQYYTNLVLGNPDQQSWGVCGIALLSSDQTKVEALRDERSVHPTVTNWMR